MVYHPEAREIIKISFLVVSLSFGRDVLWGQLQYDDVATRRNTYINMRQPMARPSGPGMGCILCSPTWPNWATPLLYSILSCIGPRRNDIWLYIYCLYMYKLSRAHVDCMSGEYRPGDIGPVNLPREYPDIWVWAKTSCSGGCQRH